MKDDAPLVDTNILVYAYDVFDKKKHEKCKTIVETAFRGDRKLTVTNQILSELFMVLTKKLKKPFSPEDAAAIVSGIIDSINWVKINYTHETVKKAVAISARDKLSIWDSLIIATAMENEIATIYTENTKDFAGQPKAINPVHDYS